ncbi:hypothetical protein, partial [Staphylococcus aureus]
MNIDVVAMVIDITYKSVAADARMGGIITYEIAFVNRSAKNNIMLVKQQKIKLPRGIVGRYI